VTRFAQPHAMLLAGALALWALIILLPLAGLYVGALTDHLNRTGVTQQAPENVAPTPTQPATKTLTLASLGRSVALAGAIAVVAVLLGSVPGYLFGVASGKPTLLLFLLLMPLLLPPYVLYYAWTLLLTPTTALGAYLSHHPPLARLAGDAASVLAVVLWYWPVAALLVGQGFRQIDRATFDLARLETTGFERLRHVYLPLLARPLLLAWALCFVLALGEFGAFHLAGVQTIGTELAVLYEWTGSEYAVAVAAGPLVAVALALAFLLLRGPLLRPASHHHDHSGLHTTASTSRVAWLGLTGLLALSLAAPTALLVYNLDNLTPLRRFLLLHYDDLAWSGLCALAAAAIGLALAHGSLAVQHARGALRYLALPAQVTILLAALVPGSLIAVALLKSLSTVAPICDLRQHWLVLSVGQAARFAGIALVLLALTGRAGLRRLTEMAALDGASRWQTFRHVYLPHTWPLWTGGVLLLTMMGMTEFATTMVLLPAGLPNFAQRLLNQMHYAADQQVIASCLILMAAYVLLAALTVLLLRCAHRRTALTLAVSLMGVVSFAAFAAGCESRHETAGNVTVERIIGQTGRSPGQFMYPRAITNGPENTLFVIDKTARVQHFTTQGRFLHGFQMPQTQAGQPTGLTCGPDSNLYIADTHYHRIMVFTTKGERLADFGQFGQDQGCFIYPTDVAFAPDGRLFVSEYGGNDRISVFSPDHRCLFTFGSPGTEPGQFARPSALCVDAHNNELYVADSCNHRIAVYSLDGQLLRTLGQAGTGPGQFRYPYDIALTSQGHLVVCEYGNNRVQLISRDGASLALLGQPGRDLGQLAYPWGLDIDRNGLVYVVDAGNNRVQVWRL